MNLRRQAFWSSWLASLPLAGLAVSNAAQAVPLYARQTGLPCSQCHTVFPELTPFGREFKLGGYTLSDNKPGKIPLAGMILLSRSDTRHSDSTGTVSFDKDGKVTAQELSLFTGGKITEHAGAFVQATYDAIEKTGGLDQTDLRYASNLSLGKNSEMAWGVSVNNNPTVQDLWNSTPAWGFPFADSPGAPTPAAGTLIEGGLEQQVGGVGLYGMLNDWLYGEISLYHTGRNGLGKLLTIGDTIDTVIDGVAPYWRLTAQHEWGSNYLSAGTFGLQADVFPGGATSGPKDKFTDYGIDAQYQHITDPHIVSAEASWIHERQNWDASHPAGDAANGSDHLNSFHGTLSYFYQRKWGGTLGYFATNGSTDTGLYAPDPVEGSLSGKPDSRGYTLELDYLPWEKARIGVQYTHYAKFNGGDSNYDGFGRSASDNDTVYLYTWLLF